MAGHGINMGLARLKALSFVADRDGVTLPKPVGNEMPRCFWNVKPTGDISKDDIYGRRLGLEYLAFEEASTDGCSRLPSIIRDMPRDITMIEIAFLTMVGLAAADGAHRARRASAYWDACALKSEAA